MWQNMVEMGIDDIIGDNVFTYFRSTCRGPTQKMKPQKRHIEKLTLITLIYERKCRKHEIKCLNEQTTKRQRKQSAWFNIFNSITANGRSNGKSAWFILNDAQQK